MGASDPHHDLSFVIQTSSSPYKSQELVVAQEHWRVCKGPVLFWRAVAQQQHSVHSTSGLSLRYHYSFFLRQCAKP